jgi:hypothetical protein
VRSRAILREEHISGLNGLLNRLTAFVEDVLIVSPDPYLPSVSVFVDVSVARSADRMISIHDLCMLGSPAQIRYMVVLAVPIDMVHGRKIVRIRDECLGDESGDDTIRPLSVFA